MTGVGWRGSGLAPLILRSHAASHGVSKDEGFQLAAPTGPAPPSSFETQTQAGLLLRMRNRRVFPASSGVCHLSSFHPLSVIPGLTRDPCPAGSAFSTQDPGSPLRSGRDDRVGVERIRPRPLILRSHAASHGVSKDEGFQLAQPSRPASPRPSRRRPQRVCSSG